jgi:hypothetical protein
MACMFMTVKLRLIESDMVGRHPGLGVAIVAVREWSLARWNATPH